MNSNILMLLLSFWSLNAVLQAGHMIQQSKRTFRSNYNFNPDQKRLDVYGDRDKSGYGYIRDVLKDIPDSRLRPTFIYSENRVWGDTFLQESRINHDDNFVIGIGIKEEETQTQAIAEARPFSSTLFAGLHCASFRTGTNFDRLDKIVFPKDLEKIVDLQIFDSSNSRKILSNLRESEKNPYTFEPETEILNFSYARGASDFIICAKSPMKFPIQVYATKAYLKNYRIVNRDKNNFFAIQKDKFETLKKSGNENWRRFLERFNG